MAFPASLTDLQAETSCPICLDFLRDPVTIDCGHNFCCPCITQCWEDLQDVLSCPVCLHHCLDRNFKRNTQLCQMTEIVKQFPIRRKKRKQQGKKLLWEKHNQVVTLFCEKDLELLCPQCRVFSDHRDHNLMSLEEAAASERKKLKSHKKLKKKVKKAEKDLDSQVSKSFKFKSKVEIHSFDLGSDLEQFMQSLQNEQDAIILGLVMEEKDIQEKLIENNKQISEHISLPKNMLNEITEKCVQSQLELLKDVDNIYKTYENLKTPAVFSYELRKENYALPPQYFSTQKIINMFKVDLSLDAETAHSKLSISEDRKTVNYGKEKTNFHYNPKRFTFHPAVLSSEGFDCARHFWQVEVRGTGEWSLGVCKDSFPRNAIVSALQKNGCWQIQQKTNTPDTMDRRKSRWISIFLDYELGEVSFYNMHTRSHIYTFADTFSEKIRPYFSTGPTSNSLTLCISTDGGDEW